MFGALALLSAATFFGAAVYINVAEHPARLELDDRTALVQWRSAYKRGFVMQASLAVLSGLLGAAAWWRGGDPLWAVGAACILANWPFTMLAIMPVNRRLETAMRDGGSGGTRALLVTWGRLHGVRSILGGIATFVYFLAALPVV